MIQPGLQQPLPRLEVGEPVAVLPAPTSGTLVGTYKWYKWDGLLPAGLGGGDNVGCAREREGIRERSAGGGRKKVERCFWAW